MKKLLASKTALFLGKLLVDAVPGGTTVKDGIVSSIATKSKGKFMLWAVLGLGILSTLYMLLKGAITFEQFERVVVLLSEVIK